MRSWSGGDGTDCKMACLCRLPQTEGWHEKISAGLQGAAEKNDGLSMEGDEHERAYEIVCIADESG